MYHFVSLLLELIWISFISSSSAGEESLEKHPTNITVEPGQNVILPCRTPDSKPVIAVEWSRTDLGSEYVLLYRNDRINLEHQHPSFKNRVDLQEGQIKAGDVSLVLKNVSTDDRGTYECRVIQTETNSRRQTVLYINLDVVPPPDQRNMTAELGQNVTLPCRALDSKPIIVVEWDRTDLGVEYVILFRNDQFDLENQHPSFKNRVDLQEGQIKDGDVSLTVKNVVTDDRGTYECRVSQSETNSRRETVIYIKLDVVPPPDPTNITAELGQNVTLPCRAPHSKPVIAVEWARTDLESEYVLLYRNDRINLEHQHPSFKDRVDLQEEQIMVGDVSLVLKNVSTDDRGTYECLIIQMETNHNRETVLYIKLDVVPPPDQRNITAELGQNVTLPCRAFDIKPIIVVEWDRTDLGSEYVILYRNNQFDLENQHPSFKNRVDLQQKQIKTGDVSLTVKNVVTDDRGTYECRVSQSETNSRRQTVIYIKLDVVPPPGEPDDKNKNGSGQLSVVLLVAVIMGIVIVIGVFVMYRKKLKFFRPPDEAAEPEVSIPLDSSAKF
ncbi:neural cell adhesion molecule 2-like [Fundulus heteroclitus]|uniref:neural cell adhesion molecule 2-like n=1 Tax=Fundulus heteroclitus TaxID=8078 RepID=UPI00165CA17B|nr:neural cell adhesion molecule 2-like [Fundulus heteroclitus]